MHGHDSGAGLGAAQAGQVHGEWGRAAVLHGDGVGGKGRIHGGSAGLAGAGLRQSLRSGEGGGSRRLYGC